MRERGQAVRSGDTIQYIVCTTDANGDASNTVLSDRCFAPEEIARNSSLRVDCEWYLGQQVHPPVARLCEHVEGTDSARIAACLGLDAQKYTNAVVANGKGGVAADLEAASFTSMALVGKEERYRNLDPLVLTCLNCGRVNSLPLSGTSVLPSPSIEGTCPLDCGGCGSRPAPITVYYQLLAAIRKHQTTYHSYFLQCDEPGCQMVTRQMRLYESQCPRMLDSMETGSTCPGTMVPAYPSQRLYHQLLYFRDLFAEPPHTGVPRKSGADEGYGMVRMLIGQTLNQCAFPIINLQAIFSFVTTK